jgi:DNA mismatch repair protein MutS
LIDESKYTNLFYQSKLLESVYVKHKGILDILQQLDIEGAEHNYSRIALTLLLEFVLNHDKTVIDKLERPEIIINNDKYLMLANNCLEQLDIIDNLRQDMPSAKCLSAKRISLLDLLDNTKTPLGKNLFRKRLSIPITDTNALNKCYSLIGDLLELHNKYMNGGGGGVGGGGAGASKDKYGSP